MARPRVALRSFSVILRPFGAVIWAPLRTSLEVFWGARSNLAAHPKMRKTNATDFSNVDTNDETCMASASVDQRGGRPCGALGPPGRPRVECFSYSRTPFETACGRRLIIYDDLWAVLGPSPTIGRSSEGSLAVSEWSLGTSKAALGRQGARKVRTSTS